MQQEEIVDDPIYRQQLMRQLRACHDGGSDAMYESMYEASMVRDEGIRITSYNVCYTKLLRLREAPF